MKLRRLLPAAALALCAQGLLAQCSVMAVDRELFEVLRRKPTLTATIASDRIDVVNERFEPCTSKKEVQYIRVISPAAHGYHVRVQTPHGFVLMTGMYADPLGKVPHGDFRYYDDAGTLRAEGRYVDGHKIGIWHRYDDRGVALSDKQYDGLDWEGVQIKLGLASECCQLDGPTGE